MFLLDFSAEKLSIIDIYCHMNWIFRTVLLRQIIDQWLRDNTNKIKDITKQINTQSNNLLNSYCSTPWRT